MMKKSQLHCLRGESKKLSPFSCLKKEAGFSLIELLIVLTLLVVISALVFPNLKTYYTESLTNQAIRRVSDLVDYARYEAAHKQTILKLSLDRDQNTIELMVQDGDEFTAYQNRFGRAYSFPDHLTLSSASELEAFFYPDGTSSKVNITLNQEKGGYIEMSTNALFGSIIIRKTG